MMKFVIAGVAGLAVAAGLGVAGYQAGLFDSFKPAVPQQQEAAQQETAPAAATTAAKDAADASAPAAAAPSILPTFDVVRIEKTGDAVIAGLAEPKATVALVANGAVIAKTTANSSGEWAIVLEQPLAPGDYDVAIRAESAQAGKAVDSLQRVTVSIPKDQGEVLVVMNAEGEASTILQKPMTATDAEKTVVAEAPGQGEQAQTTTEKTRATAALQEETTKPVETQPTVVASAEPPATEDKPAAEAGTADAQAQAEQPAEAANPDAPAVVAQAPAAEPAAPEAAKEPAAEPVPGAAAPETVAQAPASEPVSEAAPATEQTEQTAQSEPAAARDEAPAETVVAAAPAASEPAAGEPAAQAETPAAPATDAAQPAAEPAAQTAAETATGPASEQAAAEPQSAPETQAPAAASNPAVSVEAVETEKGRLFVAGTSEPGASVRIYVGDQHVGDAQAGSNGRWLLEADTPLAAGQHIVRADQVGAGDGAVVARAEVTFEREPDEVILRPVAAAGDASGSGAAGGEGAAAVAQLPNVIIRRGDNLWQISKRLYGQGLRYTTIYQANKDQIRNPDLIYPGQVFLTPKGDASWDDANAPATVN